MRTLRLLALAAAAALACVHGGSAKDRRSAEIHHDLGVEALRAGRWPDAIREFDQAIALDDRFPEAHRGRGLTLDLGFGRTAEAEAEYRRAIELRPSFSEARNDLGQLLARTGRPAEAVTEFDAAMENMLYKEPYVARCNKGLTLYGMGRKQEGLAELKATVAAAPTFCKGRRELGRVYLEAGQAKEALEELSAYSRWCDKIADAHLQLGLARMKSGDLAGAREALERCLELGGTSPEGEECRRTLALLQ